MPKWCVRNPCISVFNILYWVGLITGVQFFPNLLLCNQHNIYLSYFIL
nr:MAG TPA: hypothetical protein [Caudoviricetes sp.]